MSCDTSTEHFTQPRQFFISNTMLPMERSFGVTKPAATSRLDPENWHMSKFNSEHTFIYRSKFLQPEHFLRYLVALTEVLTKVLHKHNWEIHVLKKTEITLFWCTKIYFFNNNLLFIITQFSCMSQCLCCLQKNRSDISGTLALNSYTAPL